MSEFTKPISIDEIVRLNFHCRNERIAYYTPIINDCIEKLNELIRHEVTNGSFKLITSLQDVFTEPISDKAKIFVLDKCCELFEGAGFIATVSNNCSGPYITINFKLLS